MVIQPNILDTTLAKRIILWLSRGFLPFLYARTISDRDQLGSVLRSILRLWLVYQPT